MKKKEKEQNENEVAGCSSYGNITLKETHKHTTAENAFQANYEQWTNVWTTERTNNEFIMNKTVSIVYIKST